MIFVNNQNELEYYNSSRIPCYFDAIFAPTDVLLQANGFVITGTPVTTIYACYLAGITQSDVTSLFDIYFGSYTLGGNTYYFANLRCTDYDTYMRENRCFTLKVEIEIDGLLVFGKWTQQYKIITVSTGVFVPDLLIDDVLTPPCIPGSNPAICIGGSTQYVKFSSTFDCSDAYTGEYYAEGDAVYGTPFAFTRTNYLDVIFRDIPTEVERIISINNRTQKTAYTGQWTMSGNVLFPNWKRREIEHMFRANNLYVDDTLFQAPTQVAFTQATDLPIDCKYYFKLLAKFQQDFEWQIFGCVPDCATLATFYLFPAPFEKIYDDSKRLVATDPTTLGIYFESISGTEKAEDMPYTTPCPTYALFRVSGTGVLPKYLYVDQPIPQQRVFPRLLPFNTTDMSVLCNGVTNNNQVPTPDVTGENDEDIVVSVPDVTGVEDVSGNQYTVAITLLQGWTANAGYNSVTNYEGEGQINLSIYSTSFISPYTNQILGVLDVEGRPIRDILITDTDNGNMPPSSTLLISVDGTLTYNGQSTSQVGNTYTLELFNIKYPL